MSETPYLDCKLKVDMIQYGVSIIIPKIYIHLNVSYQSREQIYLKKPELSNDLNKIFICLMFFNLIRIDLCLKYAIFVSK